MSKTLPALIVDGQFLGYFPPSNAEQIEYKNGETVKEALDKKVSDNPTFTEAQTRANIASGETFATILGKIKKWFTDLPNMFVSKSGGIISGVLEVKPTTTANTLFRVAKVHSSTTNAPSDVVIGNNIPDETAGASNGRILLYGLGSYYALISAENVTTTRYFQFPDKSGTLALISDIPNIVIKSGTFPSSSGFSNYISYPTGMDKNNTIVLAINVYNSNTWRSGTGTAEASERIFAELATNGIHVYNNASAFFDNAFRIVLTKV